MGAERGDRAEAFHGTRLAKVTYSYGLGSDA